MMLNFAAPVLLLGHGPVAPGALAVARVLCPQIIAADGGADHALALGLRPDHIIGDLDSAASLDHWRAAGVPVHHDAGQDTTDFEKCLAHIAAPRILALGFSAGRADHYLANAATLVRLARSEVIILDDTDLGFACPDPLAMNLPEGTRVSLMPFVPVRARSTGLHWPLDGLELAPLGRLGTSNRATGPVDIRNGAGLWIILPATALSALLPAQPRVHG